MKPDKTLSEYADQVFASVSDFIARSIKPISVRLAALEALAPGRDGRDGKPGEPGRDGAQIEVLPEINPERSYSRGTWAAHNGGLWRAHTTTDGMTGWGCIVEGMHELSVELLGARTVVVTTVKSSGARVIRQVRMPVTVDRGVYVAGKAYEQGDGVTYGGSFFIAQRDTQAKPEAKGGDWRLSVKRGRAARETT